MVLEQVKKILAEHFAISEDAIKNDTDIFDDLGADSLDGVELMMAFEEAFDMLITEDQTHGLKTVDQIVQYIESM